MLNRAHAFMPPGTVAPFVIRYDAGTLPVGYLVLSSPSRTLGEIQDLALNHVRPVFATLPGVSSPPPFGGNQRTIVINVDPQKLHSGNRPRDRPLGYGWFALTVGPFDVAQIALQFRGIAVPLEARQSPSFLQPG